MAKAMDQNRRPSLGGTVFALTLVGLGIVGFTSHGFIPTWQPVPKWAPWRDLAPILVSAVSLACGAGLLFRRTAALTARLLLALLIVWLLALRVRVGVLEPTVAVYWENVGEASVYVAGAWTLYAHFGDAWDRRIGFAVGEDGLRIARAVFGLAMIAFGFAHLVYVKETAALVPNWLPGHEGWARFTGWAYVLSGTGVLTSVAGRLAASLAAWQIFGFTALVWAPKIWAGSRSPDVWSEALVSWMLTVSAWVVAGSYRGARWLGERAP